MDLSLSEGWPQCEGDVFRDDLGPTARVACAVRRPVICGLRDWRVPAPARGFHTNASARPAPALVPYRAPAWLRVG